MSNDKDLQGLAEAVKDLFRMRRQEFRAEDFVGVAELLGFHAHEKCGSDEALKPVAENYLPDLIGMNLQYAVEAYTWETRVPMTDDGVLISGFFNMSKEKVLPKGYVMDEEKRVLMKRV